MNHLEQQIELYLEEVVQRLECSLHHAREALRKFREHHGRPMLRAIVIGFESTKGGTQVSTSIGSVSLSTAGQTATARITRFIDQNGKDMPSSFQPPAVSYSIDDTEGKVVKAVDNGDNTATITAVGDGTAVLTATLKSAEGLTITKTGTITVSLSAPPPPPAPVLTDIELGFDS